jgi:hypothetical protein
MSTLSFYAVHGACLFQLFLRQGKGSFAHHRRNGRANPLRSRTLVICTVAFRHVFPLTQQVRDKLPRGAALFRSKSFFPLSDSGDLREELLPTCPFILWMLA